MARHFKQGLWLRRLAASLVCSLLLVPLQAVGADGVGEVGFLARAQRAQLVISGMVGKISVGFFGCGHGIDVENVLLGSLERDRLSLVNMEGKCPELSFHHRFILAFGEEDESTLSTLFRASMDSLSGPLSFDYPNGTSWKVFLDDEDYVLGELSGCSVSQGPGTHAPERIRWEALIALLSGPAQNPGASRQPDTGFDPRVIEGEIRDFHDLPIGMHLEFVPLEHPDRAVAISTDDWGRFRVTGVPGEAVWLRSIENDIDPILVQPGVTVVNALKPSCSTHAQVWMR